VATEWSPSKMYVAMCPLQLPAFVSVWEDDDPEACELLESYVMCQYFRRSTTLSTAGMG